MSENIITKELNSTNGKDFKIEMNVPIRTVKDFNTETELFMVNTRIKQDLWNNIP